MYAWIAWLRVPSRLVVFAFAESASLGMSLIISNAMDLDNGLVSNMAAFFFGGGMGEWVAICNCFWKTHVYDTFQGSENSGNRSAHKWEILKKAGFAD